jgi:glycosyltransferase involved in cell wall biosynthesis
MEKRLPTFSICIPNYNYANYLGATIESVLKQSYPHFEIIVVDNASTDNSLEVAESFHDSRIKVFKNNYNVGFAPNLQIATSHASMDFINLLSSDDIMKPNALQTYADLILTEPEFYDCLVLASDNEVINKEGLLTGYKYFDVSKHKGIWSNKTQYESYKQTVKSNHRFEGLQVLKYIAPELNTLAGFLTIVYSRKIWSSVAGYNAVRSIGPDKFFNYKLLLQDPKVIYVSEPLYQYRFHESANINAYYSTIKQQIDDYMNVLELKDRFSKEINLPADVLVKNYLNRFCFRFSISNFKHGRYLHSIRTFFFGLASFPEVALTQKLFYLNVLVLVLFPLSMAFFSILRLIKK